jgi:outer membrane protein
MKKAILLVLIFFFAFSGVSLAKSSLKVAVVDIQRVFSDFSETKEATKRLNLEVEAKRKELEERGKRIEEMEEELRASILLSEEERARRKKEIEEEKRKLNELIRIAQEGFLEKEQGLAREIVEKIREVIEELAKDKGIDLVVDKFNVLYNTSKLDLTDEVLKRLMKKRK